MMEANPKFAPLAVYLFKRNSIAKTFQYLPTYPPQTMVDWHQHTSIYSRKIFEKILKAFGHLIQHMKVTYNEIQGSELTNKLLSKYCSKSLVSLEVCDSDAADLKTFKKPFEKVVELKIKPLPTLQSSLLSWPTQLVFPMFQKYLKLNQVFPELRKLIFTLNEVTNLQMLSVEFPKLQDMQINYLHPMYREYTESGYQPKTAAFTEKMFIKNAHIRNLTLTNVDRFQYLKDASDNLPELEFLKVAFVEQQNYGRIFFDDKIHFKTVKKLDLWFGRHVEFFDTVTFDQLIEVNLNCKGGSCGSVPVKNKQLTKLHVEGYTFENGKLLKLIQNVPNLENLFLENDPKFEDTDSVIEYMKRSVKLNKFSFVNGNKKLRNSLRAALPDGWTMECKDHHLGEEVVHLSCC